MSDPINVTLDESEPITVELTAASDNIDVSLDVVDTPISVSLVDDVPLTVELGAEPDSITVELITPEFPANPVVDSVRFRTDAGVEVTEGQLAWNATDNTLDLGHLNGVTQQLGQETLVRVRNVTDSTIENGTPVYISGRQGNRPTIAPALGDVHDTSVVLGLVTEDIAHNSDGFVTTFGYVRQIKTNYSGTGNWGTTWQAGDNLYASKTIEGQLTNVEPDAPHHSDIIGQVGIVGAQGIGSIFVNIRHHSTLAELSDINGTPLTVSGQIPVWNNTAGYFDFDFNINDYVPYTNALNSVNLGNNNLTANNIIATNRVDSRSVYYANTNDGNINIGDDYDTLNPNVFYAINIGTFNEFAPPSGQVYIPIAIGINNKATGDLSIAIGTIASATNQQAIMIGTGTVSGALSCAVGNNVLVEGFNSIAIGTGVKVYEDSSIGIGKRIENEHAYAIVLACGDYESFSRTDNSIQLSIRNTSGAQHDLLHAEVGKGVRIGDYQGESIAMTGKDLYVAGHTEVKDKMYGLDDVELTTASKGIILKSPNGTRYKITVDNGGTIISTAL